MKESLDQSSRKSEPIPIVIANGRMRRVNLILPVVVGRMPGWLGTQLTPHMELFARESFCPDLWFALFRLSFVKDWHTRWGSTPEQEWLVSVDPVPTDEQRTMLELSKALKVDIGMSLIDSRHLFAPKGTWSRR